MCTREPGPSWWLPFGRRYQLIAQVLTAVGLDGKKVRPGVGLDLAGGSRLGVDQERIASFRSYVDSALQIRETFVQPRIGGAQTVGVLSTPLDSTPTGGWIICHSFALEHVYLQSMESAVARRLAATGFAVLRFHSQGYG